MRPDSALRRNGPPFAIVAAALVAGVVITLAVGPSGSASGATAAATEPAPIGAGGASAIAVNAALDNCGAGWSTSQGGALSFAVTNTSLAGMEVYLQGAENKLVYGEVEGLGSGASADLTAQIGDGSYRFVCLGDDADPSYGPPVTVTGSAAQSALTPGILPVTRNDLYGPTKAYSAWITMQLPVLADAAHRLAAATAAGDRSAAQQLWIEAHGDYEKLGAAYDAFGTFDAAINGTPTAGRPAATDPDLTGFHRIESQLWSDTPVVDAAPVAAQLVTDIAGLQSAFVTARLEPLDLGIRAHEILENTVEQQLDPGDDSPSETTLATIDANLEGTRQAVEPLRDLLASRSFDLQTLDAWLARDTALVESFRGADGSWVALAAIPAADREKLNADLSQTVELLAPIAAICDIRRAASI